jgi:hypothetical protein
MRDELVKGSAIFIETQNNQQKTFVPILKFWSEAYAMLQRYVGGVVKEQDNLNPKKTIEEYQTYVKVTHKYIKKQDVMKLNEGTGQILITQPGRV